MIKAVRNVVPSENRPLALYYTLRSLGLVGLDGPDSNP